MDTTKAVRRLWGSIEAGPRAVTIRGLGSAETIPYERIASVQTDWWHGKIEIETASQVRAIAVWNPFRLAPLAAAIRWHIEDVENARAAQFRPAFAHPTESLVSVDDGGPGEFGTFRKRDGSAYEDTPDDPGWDGAMSALRAERETRPEAR